MLYLPEEVIFRKGDLEEDASIYFIEKGCVEMFSSF